jgi:hypothetical protein
MVIVVLNFHKGAGQQRIVALPGARNIVGQDSGPTRIGMGELNWVGGQEKMVEERRRAQQE